MLQWHEEGSEVGTAAQTVEESELAREARTAELRDMRSRSLHLDDYATAQCVMQLGTC